MKHTQADPDTRTPRATFPPLVYFVTIAGWRCFVSRWGMNAHRVRCLVNVHDGGTQGTTEAEQLADWLNHYAENGTAERAPGTPRPSGYALTDAGRDVRNLTDAMERASR